MADLCSHKDPELPQPDVSACHPWGGGWQGNVIIIQ
jgi:hypothetical protein